MKRVILWVVGAAFFAWLTLVWIATIQSVMEVLR